MRLLVIAVGRMKAGPERDLAARYETRITDIARSVGLRGCETHELAESRARDAQTRMSEEGAAMAALIPDKSIVIALDERGENVASESLAQKMGSWRDAGAPCMAFVIGGADGLAPQLRDKAKLTLAFGRATWPHQLARVMLYEQIYRAATILAGHPYHRV